MAARLAEGAHRNAGAVNHHINHRRLKACRQILDIGGGQWRDALGLKPHRCFQAGKRKIRLGAAHHRARQRKALRIARRRGALDHRPTGVAEAEQLGDLVKSLACRVIDGGTQPQVIANATYAKELAVAARHQQRQIGEFQRVREAGGQRVRFQMIDGAEGLARRQAQNLAGGKANQHTADQAGAGRRRNAIKITEPDIRALERPPDEMIEIFNMGTRRDFRHDAAIRSVQRNLAHHFIGENLTAAARSAAHDGGCRLVAGCLNPQNQHKRQ